MLNERLKVAQDVRDALLPAEDAADLSYLRALKLAVALCEGRRRAGTRIDTAQAAIEEVNTAVYLAGQARSAIINAHRHCAQDLHVMLPGIEQTMVGDGCPWPPAKAVIDEARPAARLAAVS